MIILSAGCAHRSTSKSKFTEELFKFKIQAPPANYNIERLRAEPRFSHFEAASYDGQTQLTATLYKDTDPENIKHRFEEKEVKVKSIFDPVRDVYFAVLTQNIQCEPRYQAKFFKEKSDQQTKLIVSAFGNERNTIGACDESTVKRKIILVLLRCRNSLAEVQFSTDLNRPDFQMMSEAESLKCLD